MASKYPPSYAPRFLVKIGSEKFHEYSGYVSDLVVDSAVDGADHCEVTLTYPFDHEHQSFDGLKWKKVKPGKKLEVSLGYGENTTKVFVGEVETVEPEYPPEQPPKVVITGYSALRKMMQGTNSKSWKKKKIGKVVKSVASDSLRKVKTKKANTKLERVFQDGQSDYDFVTGLADKYGFDFVSVMGEGRFVPKSGDRASGDPVAELYYGESLESFEAEMRRPSHGKVEVRHWDTKKKKKITGTASNDGGKGKRVFRVPVESKSKAKEVAKAKLDGTTVSGVAETFGIPTVVAGVVVKLKGLGKKFTNNYYVTRATHRMGASGYSMSFEVRRSG